MARISVSLAVASSKLGGEAFSGLAIVGDVVNASGYTADKTAFEAALATCVADGASPTQAHVSAANTAYTTFAADLAAPPATTDIVLSFDTAKAPSIHVLEKALDRLLKALRGSSYVTL